MSTPNIRKSHLKITKEIIIWEQFLDCYRFRLYCKILIL